MRELRGAQGLARQGAASAFQQHQQDVRIAFPYAAVGIENFLHVLVVFPNDYFRLKPFLYKRKPQRLLQVVKGV